MKNKRFAVYFLTIIILMFSVMPVYADSQFWNYCCGEEFMSSISTAHLRNINKKQEDNDISLFSTPLLNMDISKMPSTGDVKVLVLPIDFKDEKLDAELVSYWNERYFGVTNENLFDTIELYQFGVLSMADRNHKYVPDNNDEKDEKGKILGSIMIYKINDLKFKNKTYIKCVISIGTRGKSFLKR